MDRSKHSLETLFAQLGLPNDAGAIEQFIAKNRPLKPEIQLADAPFWKAGQSRFLKEGIQDDSDWAEVIDELDALLRH